MSRLMFYERPVPLNRERHQALKLAIRSDHFRFAARTNAVPIAGSEITEAARDYPVVFVGEAAGPFNVAALVGLREAENLMVDAQGRWAADRYVPAFARRYPFVLAATKGSDRLTVCVDEVYAGLGVQEGEALFSPDGQETPYLRRVLDFLSAFHQDAQRACAFAGQLKDLGLLVPKAIQVQRADQPAQNLRGVWIVDAQRLRELGDAQVLQLFRSGALAWLHAHLASLATLPRLVARLGEHSQMPAESAEPGATDSRLDEAAAGPAASLPGDPLLRH